MNGHLRQRSAGSWEIRWRANGRTFTRTIRGGKRQAEAALRAALVAADRGEAIAPSRLTIGQLVAERIQAWHGAGRISGRTRESYEIAAKRLEPIEDIAVQRLGSADVERWHLGLKHLSGSAKRNTHGVLQRALADAVRHKLCTRNAASDQGPPPSSGKKVGIAMLTADEIATLLSKLGGDEWRVPVVTAIYCGLRRSEQLALKWNRIDLDGAKMQIVEALDEANGQVTVKSPKSRAGTRTITLPAIVINALRSHRREQLERCVLLGLGRPASDSLVFPAIDGSPQGPRAFSLRWGRAAARLGVPQATWHSLRHSHASMLISAGLPITVVAARLGHANPAVTLKVYARLFAKDDAAAAAAINAALGQ